MKWCGLDGSSIPVAVGGTAGAFVWLAWTPIRATSISDRSSSSRRRAILRGRVHYGDRHSSPSPIFGPVNHLPNHSFETGPDGPTPKPASPFIRPSRFGALHVLAKVDGLWSSDRRWTRA